MNQSAPLPPTPVAPVTLSAVLRTPTKNRLLAREPVSDADLAPVRAEAWLEGILRKGGTHIPLADAGLRLTPIFHEGSTSRCAGFAYEGEGPDGQVMRCEFTIRGLSEVPQRAAEKLVERGVLQPNEKYTYEIVVDDTPRAAAPEPPFAFSVKTSPLRALAVPLPPLLSRARAVNEPDDAVFPVFFTEQSCQQAEKISRRGAAQNPPVETGGALVGALCSSNDGEFFVVVTHVLEAVEADTKEFSLEFTSRSWTRIQTVLKARQAAQPAMRLLGNCHGHNFSAGEPCAVCPTVERCDKTTVWASSDDKLWSAAVMCHQPWALCLIHGTNARLEKLHSLYGLRDGRLTERGYFVLPEFDPDQWEIKPELKSPS